MPSSSRKKAIARRLTRDWVAGYLPADGFVHAGDVELLGLEGKVLSLPADTLKWICFVRDFNSGELNNPERLVRKAFGVRPRTEGVFLRLTLKDGDQVEGLAANDVSLVTGEGLFLTPPDIRSNTQRIWVPRSSVEAAEVVAVIGGAAAKPAKKKPAEEADETQERLF
ncbi:DUF6982 domain-containing protein [Paracidobacterium acidisoli]|uniref:Uncharacterized protein n=1 Tax=Paracidobacterium acidisoli TaxID=2303751 RepID=A0A372IS13_9BACT|nr:hypothetical protein [Paracidobacterium acidisoli]MBT9330444.1 hypothetical protein [Paracidobacterium acidisoli]